MKPNQIQTVEINEFPEIAPLANAYPPKDCVRFQDMGLHFSSARFPEKQKKQLCAMSVYVRASNLEFEKLDSKADHINSDWFCKDNHV